MDGEDALDTSQLERRHITVLECDLVGSTKLASNLDPEEFRDLILAYQDCVTALVEEYNGYFVQFAGDAVWSYFGYPFAHEDDACQAIRAGLAITKAANSLKIYNKSLNVRIGIASGLCVVGNMRQASEESKKENQITAFGNPPNLASRLQTLVIPGSVAVSDDTRYLAGDLFDFEDLGFHKIKGFSKETKVWRVIGESVERNRFRALRPKSQSPIVGRENELVTLSDLWKRSCSGKGKVVYISGEPGIGKSRLVSSLAETIVGSRYLQWWLHCAEYSQGSAFAPVITHIQAQSGIRDSDDIHARFKKLAGKYSEFNSDELYFLAELLLVESVSNLKTPIISASKRRESIYEVLIKLLIQEAEERPLLIVAEDAHWIDPSTHELLQRLSLRVEFLPVLLVITSRVTEDNGNHYLKLSYSHKIKVEQLQQNDSFKLIDSLWNLNELPEQLIALGSVFSR
jgi:class 3 adenylate cyclase